MTKWKNTRNAGNLLSFIGIVVTCILLNHLGARLNGLLGLPLFIDNIGTILSAVLGGYVPCITVGFFSNLVAGLSDSSSIYYCVISVFIAAAAVAFADSLRRVRFPQVIWAVLVFALLGGGLGGLLTWLINGYNFGEGFAVECAAELNKLIPMGYFASNLLVTFLIDVADKIVVTVISLTIYKLLPDRLITYLNGRAWHYNVKLARTDKNRMKRTSLRIKITLLVALSTTLVASAAIGTSIIQYHHGVIEDYADQASDAADVIVSHIKPKQIHDVLQNGSAAEGYIQTKELLTTVRDANPEIEFVYIYRIEEDGTHVIFDLDTKDVKANLPGDVIEYDGTISKYRDLFLQGEDIPVDITDDEYGWLLTVYKPIKGRSDKPLCYVGVDMSMSELRSQETAFLTRIISLFIGFLILIRAYAVWLADYYLIRPVNTLADASSRLAYDTPQAREESLRMIDELDIHTGDEIENLYHEYRNTTFDTVHYINEVERKSAQVSRLQNGLILVLADLVESRDQCTGDHVRKTAAYCEIILRQMQKEGIYADQLSEDFIDEVIHSAPLHDVGKIRISDTILNKPGRLTEEEFKVMQSHTSSGGEIINKAIVTVGEESEYLNEAKNMASYHHEKWNGMGYPNGLKGEEIPLSARVMAVADVFDALVSRRSYKEPFSVEKALEIIRKDSGSHFDPLVVQAFLNAEDEVRRVQKLNMEL